MDEKELLKKAFKYGNVPSNITYCFTEPCPMKDKCIQQKYIKQLFARYGYKDVEFEHFSDEIDFTKI